MSAPLEANLVGYVDRCRAVQAEGVYVPPQGWAGRVLAVMYVFHESSRRWPREVPEDELRRLDEALVAHERAHPDTAEVLWWGEFTERQGWR